MNPGEKPNPHANPYGTPKRTLGKTGKATPIFKRNISDYRLRHAEDPAGKKAEKHRSKDVRQTSDIDKEMALKLIPSERHLLESYGHTQ